MYSDAKAQPHVMVAIRLKEMGKAVRSGDTIPYIICGTAKEGALAEHAYHPDQVRRDALPVDKEWYLAQQVHPCVARLCEHLKGTDGAKLAACLGLEASKYASSSHHLGNGAGQTKDPNGGKLSCFLSDEERFKGVDPLSLHCPQCAAQNEFKGLFQVEVEAEFTKIRIGLDCPACGSRLTARSFYHQLLLAIRSHIDRYYLGWRECDEPTCRARSRQLRLYENACGQEHCRGQMRSLYTGHQLYTQLLYYRSLLEIERIKNRLFESSLSGWRQLLVEIEPTKAMLKRYLNKCDYPIIKLSEIFSFHLK